MGREVLYRVSEDNFAEIPLPAMEGGTCQECTYWQGTVTGDRSALRQQMFADGALRGKLALDASGQGVGFLQYGRLVAYPEWDKLRRQFPIESTDEAWVITYLMTHKSARGQGVARRLLRALVEQAQAEGVVIEAIGMEEADFEHVSLGPAAIYRQAGFQEVGRSRDPYGINVLLRLAP